MTDNSSLDEKINAVYPGIEEETSDEPDALTQEGIRESEIEKRKAMTAAERAEWNQRHYVESVNHQNYRYERRIDLFETEIEAVRQDLSASQSQNILLAEKAGKLAEKAGWRRWIEGGCSFFVLLGTLVVTFAAYADPGFGGVKWFTQQFLDGLFIAGLVTIAAGGCGGGWATIRS